MDKKRVAIIGAGCSGLSAIKCCLEENIIPVCFERETDIGGLWNYSSFAKYGSGGVYKSCVINTSKEMMAFSDFPPPADFPTFMPHESVLKYLRLYAEHFSLLPYIKFSTSVTNLTKSEDYEESGKWVVTYCRVEASTGVTEIFDAVMVCCGHHTCPKMPKYDGLDRFKGPVIHSHGYKKSQEFEDKRVLIVGAGNSAADIAVDLSRVAKQVFISTRSGSWVVGRVGPFGLPCDALANSRIMFSIPRAVLQWGVEAMANFKFDHETYGIKPRHRALEAHPTINDDLPYRIATGQVKIKTGVNQFEEHQVRFVDGTKETIDAVIFATGFHLKIGVIDPSIARIDNNNVELYKYMFPPDMRHHTLSIIGLVQPIGSVIPISEIQSRWFIQTLKGNCHLPTSEEMHKDIVAKRNHIRQNYLAAERHTLETFWIEYMDDIAIQFGAKPNLKTLFFQDPVLAIRCLFGPCIPAQFRLVGPGKWDGSRDAITNCLSRCREVTKTRIAPRVEKKVTHEMKEMRILYLLIMCCLFFTWLFAVY